MEFDINNYIGKSYWKRHLVKLLWKNYDTKTYQKDILNDLAGGNSQDVAKYIKELEKEGILNKSFESRKAVITLTEHGIHQIGKLTYVHSVEREN